MNWIVRCALLLPLLSATLAAQQDRIVDRVDRLRTRALTGNVHPSAKPQFDAGALDPSLRLDHVMLMFRRSNAQQVALDQLLSEQQTLSSPNYHNWLSPEQFGDRFGLSPNDAVKISSWLQSEGLVVDGVSRGRNWIWFSGTAGQIQTALRTNLRRYRVDGELHFANAIEPSVPAAIEPLVAGILGLDDFLPKSPRNSMPPLYTSASGSHSLAPDDFATIYNLNPLYNAGFNGLGQRIVVAGASAVDIADIQAFRNIYNLPPNDPQLILVPGTPDPGRTSAEIEGDLDIEWTGAVARQASILYVYGLNVVSIAIAYAIDQNLAPIITMSFGNCEKRVSPTTLASTRALAQQANAQGITWLAASGDAGAATCDQGSQSASQGLSVDFPASLAEVTGIGGTQFDAGSGNYWSASNSVNLASALSYIPEMGWNQSGLSGLGSSGGGLSVLFAQPSWQTGPGVPNGSGRAVPDLSLAAGTAVGYRVIHGGQSYVGGGTSAGTPSFAGILALVNQYQLANGSQTQSGQGNINPNLYSLAQNTTDVFHDITTGNNIVPCIIGTADCLSGVLGYAAGPGYDLVTGLGSIDGYNLAFNLSIQQSTPAIALLNPSSVIAGGERFTMAVNGSGFDAGSVVNWTGTPLPTTFVSQTELLVTVDSTLITTPGSASVVVVGARGTSAPSLLVIAPALGANLSSQRVTDIPPSPAGCLATDPPATNYFLDADTVYLYFNATTTASDSLTYDWLAPNGNVIAGGSWPSASASCRSNAGSLFLGNLSFSNLTGLWQARIFDRGSLLFSIPFGVNQLIASPFPAAGQVLPASGGSQSLTLTFPPIYTWTVSTNADWITLTEPTGRGITQLSYQVAANSGAARSGTINVAGFSFTLEQQAATIPNLSFIGSMPHVAAEENWVTTFTLVNKSSVPAQTRLNLFGDPSGELTLPLALAQHAEVPDPLLATSLDQTLSANASLTINTAGPQTPPVQIGSAQLAATGAVDGFAIFHLIPSAQEAVVPLETRNASSYLLAFDNTGGVVLGVAVQNVSPQAANIGVVIRDDTGSQLAAGPLPTLAGGGHTSFVLSAQFPQTANRRGTIQFNTPPGGRISVLGIRTTPLGSSTTLTTIPALANIGAHGGSIAHIAVSNGWETTFVLVNAGATRSAATLKFFDDGGNPLPLSVSYPQLGGNATTVSSVNPSVGAGGMLMVAANGQLSNPVQIGSAQLTTTGNISGFVIFRYNPNGQEAVVPLESRNANAYLLAFDNTNGTATGVAINNVSTQAVNIPVIVRDDTGAQVATDALNLAANGHLAFTLGTDKYPATANIRGTIEFDTPAGAQIGALGIRIPVAHTFTTLPALAK